MKMTRYLAFFLILALVVPLCGMSATAATGGATITFYPGPTPPPGGGGNPGGTTTPDTDRGGGGGGAGVGDTGEVVTILDPEIPLSSLPDLPTTGSGFLIPLLFLAVGAVLVLAAKTGEPGRLRAQTVI